MTEEDVPNVETDEKQEKNEKLSEEDAFKEEFRSFTIVASEPSIQVHGMAYTSLAKMCERVSEVPPFYVEKIAKMTVANSIRFYGHPKSFQHVQRLLQVLSKRDYSSTLKSLLSTIISSLPIVSNLSASNSQAQVPTMKWLLMVLSTGKTQELTENSLEISSALATIAYWMCSRTKAWRSFIKKFSKIFPNLKSIVESKIAELAKDHQEKTIALIAAIGDASKETLPDIFPQTFTDLISKSFLLAKLRPPQFIVYRASKFVRFLREKQDFSENLLPKVKKALLRNPEIAIFGIQGIIENIQFPLGSCAQDLLKSTSSQLSNADSEIREAAIGIVVALTRKSEIAVVQKVLNTLFDQYAAAKTLEVKISLNEGIKRVGGTVELKEIDKKSHDKKSHDGTDEDNELDFEEIDETPVPVPRKRIECHQKDVIKFKNSWKAYCLTMEFGSESEDQLGIDQNGFPIQCAQCEFPAVFDEKRQNSVLLCINCNQRTLTDDAPAGFQYVSCFCGKVLIYDPVKPWTKCIDCFWKSNDTNRGINGCSRYCLDCHGGWDVYLKQSQWIVPCVVVFLWSGTAYLIPLMVVIKWLIDRRRCSKRKMLLCKCWSLCTSKLDLLKCNFQNKKVIEVVDQNPGEVGGEIRTLSYWNDIPIVGPPHGKRYLRCPCNCLIICKATSTRIACPRFNCRRVIKLIHPDSEKKRPQMSLKHYTAQGYKAFQETLKSIGKGQRVVALFTGSKSLTTGESWCSRCAIAELVIDEVIKGADVAGIDVHFVTVFVGNREVWRDPSVGFRTDPALKLSCIPTLLEIGNKAKRLTPPDIYQAQRVKYYFTEE